MAYKLRDIWKVRDLILKSYSTREVSEITGMSISAVRLYTKSERAKMKEIKKREEMNYG